MKKFKNSFIIITALSSVILLAGCSGKKIESWAYSHEPEKEVIALYDNGMAVYKDARYTYSKDDSYITLVDKDKNETKLKYTLNGDKMTLYEKSTYKLEENTENDGIIGTWVQDNGWSYVFTPEGEFSEEGIFFGHYSVDENESCIKLMYNDPIEDAYLYYTLNGDELTVDYPWPMVNTEEK